MARLVMVRTRLTAGGLPEPVVELTAAALGRLGHEVHLLAWDREGRWPVRTQTEWGFIHRLRLACPLNDAVAFGLRLPLFWEWAEWKAARLRPTALHCHDLDTLPLGALLAGVLGVELVYDCHENYPGLVEQGVGRAMARRLHRLEAKLLHRCQGIITGGAGFYARAEALLVQGAQADFSATLEQGLEVLDRPAESFTTFPKAPALTLVDNTRPQAVFPSGPLTPAETESLASLPPLPSGLRLLYVGVLEPRPSRGVLETALALRNVEGVSFIVAGFGTLTPKLKALLPKLDNTTYLGPIEPSLVPALTRACHAVHLTNDPANANNRMAMPNKLFEAMAAAKPIITCAELLAGGWAAAQGFGLALPWGRWDRLKTAVKLLRDDPALAEQMGAKGRRLYEDRYHWGVMEERIRALYERVLG